MNEVFTPEKLKRAKEILDKPPISDDQIKWVSIYDPAGRWQNRLGDVVKAPERFRCEDANGRALLCIMIDKYSEAGHGDPAFTAEVPLFISEELEVVENAGWITVL